MNTNLRSTEEIPSKYRHIFAQFANFNRMQSEVIDNVLQSDKSLVVSAPTGSGKTVIFELAIIRLLKKLEDVNCKIDYKIIYIAPIKALCNEITADWKKKFDRLGVLCGSATGDDDDFDLNTSKYNIIITTPEKWDSLSRKWNVCEYMNAIKLLLIDEVHLLNEDKRGPILEAVVSRMKTIRLKLNQQFESSERIRFIAVSATIPNIADLASWLDDKDNTVYHKASEDSRPVKLEKHILGYSYSNIRSFTPFRFDMNLTYKLPPIIEKYSKNKPTLIFCNSRKSAEMGATIIIDKLRLNLSDEQRQKIMAMSSKIEDTKLRKTISSGVAFHHAGLCVSDKKFVEDCFRSGLLPVLFSTNTLAMGVNLPAYLVIVKSTEMLVSGTVHELSETVILQMIGRAGRPQFDDHGVAVIMTQNSKVKKYEDLIVGSAPIESHLHNHLIEHLNSEIVSQTISNMDLVIHWIRSSYLYIRAIQKPLHYGLPVNATITTVEEKLEELCVNAINELQEYGLVTKTNSSMTATQLGRLMAHYYLNFETMKHFANIKGSENVQEMFDALISCPDFVKGYHLRVNDKRTLNDLNKKSSETDCIRYPIKGKVKTVTDKITSLMQAILGNILIADSSLTEEASQLMKLGQRIGRAMQEYVAILDMRNNFSALVSTTFLLKSLHVHLWENSPYVFKQFKKIGHVYSKSLSSNGITTFESILNSSPSDIEMILKKRPPFGIEFHDAVSILPQYTVDMERKDEQICIVARQVNPKFVCDPLSRGVSLIVGDSTDETLLVNHNVQYFLVKYGIFERTFEIKNPLAAKITAHLIHNGIVGLDKSTILILRPDDPSITEPMPETEPEPKQASKRKTQEGNKRRAKQTKMSEYFNSPKKAQKRDKKTANSQVIDAKKAKFTRNETEMETDLTEQNDVIDLCDVSSPSSVSPTVSKQTDLSCIEEYTIDKQSRTEANDNKKTINSAIDFLQTFKAKKRVFQFIAPKKPDNDNDVIMDTVNETTKNDEIVTMTNAMPPPRKRMQQRQDSIPEVANVISRVQVFRDNHSVNWNNSHLTNIERINEKASKSQTQTTEQEIITDKNHLKNTFVPSCIKATFVNETYSQQVQRQLKVNSHKKKDINFRYDNLLTPLEEEKLPDSQFNFLCDVIDEQQKLYRASTNSEATVFPFYNFYIKNFSAAKELQKIDGLNYEPDEINERESISLEEFEVNENSSFSLNSSLDRLLIEPVPRPLPRPVYPKEQQKQIEPIEKSIDKITPMALNEHKYSKWTNYNKKSYLPAPVPVPTVAANPSYALPLKPTTSLRSSQKFNATMPQFFNYFDEIPSAKNNELSSKKAKDNKFVSFGFPHATDDPFQSTELSQQAMSGIFHETSSGTSSFIPSRSAYRFY